MAIDSEVLVFVTDFVRSKNPDARSFGMDDDLVACRLLDSLHFLEFLMALEERTGQEILLEDVNPEDFRTVERIAARFFAGESVPAGSR